MASGVWHAEHPFRDPTWGRDSRPRATRRLWVIAAARLLVIAVAAACVSTVPRRGAETPRVREARRRQGATVARLFRTAQVGYPARLLIVAFKEERTLELWGFSERRGRYVEIVSYRFLGSSGELGPKRRSWDHQIPEGYYHVTVLNPESLYHLSLGLDYPNASDRLLADGRDPGSDIFIHGDDVSDGCIPIGDRGIEQLYIAVLDSRSAGYGVPVEIFPCRFSERGCREELRRADRGRPELAAFWAELNAGFDLLEMSGMPPAVEVDADGRYTFPQRVGRAGGAR